MSQSRRGFIGTAAALAVGAHAARAQGQRANRPQPVRIGCITSLSGLQEVFGRPILDGARIAAEQINAEGGVLGRVVEIVEADDRADPDRAVAAARELAHNGVNLFCGVVPSQVALALSPVMPSLDAVLMTCAAASDKLTHEAFNPHYFRVSDHTYMRNRAQARLMAERYPDVSDWAALLPDVEYGRSALAAFRDGLLEYYPALAKREPRITAPVVARFGETEFGPQIAEVMRGPARGLFVAVYGGDAMALYRQARLAGLSSKIEVLTDSTNEFLVPLEFGGTTPENLWLAMTWYYGGYRHVPMGRRLYEDHLKYTGNALPSGFVSTGHAAIHAYAAAIRRCGRTQTGPVIGALEGLTFETAKGPVTFRREDHQAICDVNFVRVKSSAEPGPGMLDYTRYDIAVGEFVRYTGADVIEPPSPGKPLVYRGQA